ncbi:MAG: B12-binding domain-containing radical SAM protein [Planctomycetota bacterium]|jgi:radical SAM superfamily enzyme YgiQ (UPF0313 family)
MKLGLIAMSGMRAEDSELTRLGLTLPGFINRSRIIASLPSLGLLTLAGMTPEAIQLDYVEVPDIRDLKGLPGEYDAVAISSYTAQIKDAYELARRYRARKIAVIMGGLHVTMLPEEAMKHADCVVLGEGECAWPQVCRDLLDGKLRKIYDVRNQSFDLADSSLPKYELLDPAKYNRLTVQTHRGCPFRCEFCAASIRISPRYKIKPIAKVITEIRRIKEIWQKPFIELADDNSSANKAHFKRLVKALTPERVRWFTEADISVADDDELLSMMRDSGCAQILIGLESPNTGGLEGLELKANWKARQARRYLDAIAKIQGHGISVDGCFILGLDGTGPECFQDVLDFVHESGLYEVQITVATPFPGTPFYDRLKRAGRIIKDGAWERCTLFDVNFVPENMTPAELEAGFRNLGQKLYGDKETRLRREKFKLQLREVRRVSETGSGQQRERESFRAAAPRRRRPRCDGNEANQAVQLRS